MHICMHFTPALRKETPYFRGVISHDGDCQFQRSKALSAKTIDIAAKLRPRSFVSDSTFDNYFR